MEAGSVAQPQSTQERLVINSNNSGVSSASGSKQIPNSTATTRMPGPVMDSSSLDGPRQEKSKASSSYHLGDAKMAESPLSRKKVKRKPEVNLHDGHAPPEKSPYLGSAEKYKSSHKQATTPPSKLDLQTTAPSFKQSS